MPDAFQEGGLAHPAGAGHQTQRAGGGEVPHAGQALRQTVVGPEAFGGGVLGEGLCMEVEVFFKHGWFPEMVGAYGFGSGPASFVFRSSVVPRRSLRRCN